MTNTDNNNTQNMRRAIKDKLTNILDDPRISSTTQSLSNSDGRRQIADRVVGFVKEKSGAIASTVQEHVMSVTDTTGTLAKQKLLQTLFSSGVVQSEHIRQALQIGIGYFLDQQCRNPDNSTVYIQREKFPAIGSKTPSHSIPDFDVEAYGLDTFCTIMSIFGINPNLLRRHICNGQLKEIVNPSSSGSLLYLTSDSTYLIKTVRDYDAKFIQQKFLQEYFQYISQIPDTFIAKLFGVYGYIPYISQQRGITVDSFTLRFAIFSNIIPTNLDIHEKYDLKGSSYKRDANFNERIKSSATFKDNDFREIHPRGLKIPRQIYNHLKRILTSDAEFLERLNIMDYSLLLIIHNMDNQNKPTRTGSLEALMGSLRDTLLIGMSEQRLENQNQTNNEPKSSLRLKKPNEALGFVYEEIPTFDVEYAKEFGGIPAINGKGERLLLFLGIIDILQTFDICKVMHRQYQTVENRHVTAERSIVEADFYAKRFKEFLFERVFHPADDEIPSNIPTTTTNEQTRSSRSSIYPQLGFSE
ncbi:unnamed protein product [Adineta steineri]|uniref:PIPK domain-containing protein n=1 Tax=Adineta steineri TaxID=433720 RepID=A0A814V8C9_9BILA|nr:unnamed protein product [Adineta steineri]CAF3805936.1 unnamed protein product [Adineta steineri]